MKALGYSNRLSSVGSALIYIPLSCAALLGPSRPCVFRPLCSFPLLSDLPLHLPPPKNPAARPID